MNQEEFKAIIIGQLKNPNSLMNKSLFKGESGNYYQNSRYVQRKQYYSNELDIVADIQRIEDEGKSPYAKFDVTFKPLNGNHRSLGEGATPIDGRISYTPVREEMVIMSGTILEFCVASYGIVVRDYQFFTQDYVLLCYGKYDIVNDKFIGDRTPAKTAKEFKNNIVRDTMNYAYLKVAERDIQSIVDQMDFYEIPNNRIIKVLDALYAQPSKDGQFTTMQCALMCLDPKLKSLYK